MKQNVYTKQRYSPSALIVENRGEFGPKLTSVLCLLGLGLGLGLGLLGLGLGLLGLGLGLLGLGLGLLGLGLGLLQFGHLIKIFESHQ